MQGKIRYIEKVSIIGAGNLAWSLIPALQHAGYHITQLVSRNYHTLVDFQKAFGISRITQSLSEIDKECDAIFLTVSDSAIASTAEYLLNHPIHLIHCSGSMPLSILPQNAQANTAVLYPLQSFSRGLIVDFYKIPLFGETQKEFMPVLEALALSLSPTYHWLDSRGRKTLHLGAVWANNFSNLMYRYTEELLAQEIGLDFSIYLPLLEGQLGKLQDLSPAEAQTGPAIRGDLNTLEAHLQMLSKHPELRKLYKILSQRINPDLEL